jgi:glycosyltransferase involved in cell wall biosynthesis
MTNINESLSKKKLKIAILGPYPPATGGIVSNLQNLLKSPLKEKYDLLTFRTMSDKSGTVDYESERVTTKVRRVLGDFINYLIFLTKKKPNLVFINTSFGKFAFWRDSLYIIASKLFNKKILLQIHGGKLDDFLHANILLARIFIKNIFRLTNKVIVLSLVQQKPFNDYGYGDKTRIIPNTVDLSAFHNSSECLRKKYGIPKGNVIILFIASLWSKEKGVMELLRAAKIIMDNRRDITFILVGGGEEESAMVKYCSDNNLQDKVLFTGYLSKEEIIKVCKSSDIFSLPSFNEGLPMVILEAMAAGLPIVTTPVGAIPEMVIDGENGFIVKPGDYHALAEKINYLIENKEIRERYGHHNLNLIRTTYDVHAVAGIFDNLFKEIIH